MTSGNELEKLTSDVISIHESYVLLVRSGCFKPLAYAKETVDASDSSTRKVLSLSIGTSQVSREAASSTSPITVRGELAV